ncbi:hypothetical protein SAMN05216325_11663 [Nitrosomonas marina]|uniref:Uncharacterized protein n=1 Tax=Nitrosomonas marina TaxID=917 RepID=A0A1H8G6G7_9PROT|nr:hypothetical protein SAMN05216325_11663 [Nitrosomonas marina]
MVSLIILARDPNSKVDSKAAAKLALQGLSDLHSQGGEFIREKFKSFFKNESSAKQSDKNSLKISIHTKRNWRANYPCQE